MFRCEPLFVFLLASVLWLHRCPVAPDVLDAPDAPDVPDVPFALTHTSRLATNALPVSAKRTCPLHRFPPAREALGAPAAPDVPEVPFALTQPSRLAPNALPVSAKRPRPLHPCRNPPCSARCTARAHPYQLPNQQRSPREREAHMVP